MSQWLTPIAVPIVVALIAPFFAYLVATRRLSGRINTTEAAELWHEASSMRAEYRQKAEQCEKQLRQLRNEMHTVVARNTILSRENKELREALREYDERA